MSAVYPMEISTQMTQMTRNPMPKKRIIFLDIDDTLIDFNRSKIERKVVWTGGSVLYWQYFCRSIRILDKIWGYETSFGVITFKNGSRTRNAKKRGDMLSRAVIGEDKDSEAQSLKE